jgi:hypothetical protein
VFSSIQDFLPKFCFYFSSLPYCHMSRPSNHRILLGLMPLVKFGEKYNYEAPHYAVFTNLLSLTPSPHYIIFRHSSICVFPLK